MKAAPKVPKKKIGLSKAAETLLENLADIARLLELHAGEGGDAPGRRYGLEVLNRSAIVLLTAFWEAFCEDLASEGLEELVKSAKTHTQLPLELRKKIGIELKSELNHLEHWKLAGDGWRPYLRTRLAAYKEKQDWDFKTPRNEQIDTLFLNAVGIPEISKSWKWHPKTKHTAEKAVKELSDFITLRGEIAHRGKTEVAVRKAQVLAYRKLIEKLASIMDFQVFAARTPGLNGKPLDFGPLLLRLELRDVITGGNPEF